MFKQMIKITSVAVLATSLSLSMSVTELNKASKDVLMKINGIGSKKADAIIAYRAKTAFKSIEDVEKVKGVGKALAKNIKNDVYKKSSKSKKIESKKEKKKKKATSK